MISRSIPSVTLLPAITLILVAILCLTIIPAVLHQQQPFIADMMTCHTMIIPTAGLILIPIAHFPSQASSSSSSSSSCISLVLRQLRPSMRERTPRPGNKSLLVLPDVPSNTIVALAPTLPAAPTHNATSAPALTATSIPNGSNPATNNEDSTFEKLQGRAPHDEPIPDNHKSLTAPEYEGPSL